MVKKDEKKEINVEQVIAYLSNAFSKASRHLGSHKNQKGTSLYDFQVELMYMLDDIKRGPKYIVPKRIAEANELIEHVSGFSEEKEGV